jgi:hypothetical protein
LQIIIGNEVFMYVNCQLRCDGFENHENEHIFHNKLNQYQSQIYACKTYTSTQLVVFLDFIVSSLDAERLCLPSLPTVKAIKSAVYLPWCLESVSDIIIYT